ncbi:MAG: 30S ribosome-binding factor RbfA [Bryobacteraceae bacterium]|nr:30S ribosome-binding factor RbfA [Bryobacteraceae bacterium]
MEPHRLERTTEAIREVLSEMIALEMEDPRLDGLEVVEVNVSPDKRHAYVAIKSHEGTITPDTLAALEGARGFLKREVGQRLGLFRSPELHFDTTANFGPQKRVDSILKRIRKGRPKDEEKPA